MARRVLEKTLDDLLQITTPAALDTKLAELAQEPDSHSVIVELDRAARGLLTLDVVVSPTQIKDFCQAVKNSLVQPNQPEENAEDTVTSAP